MTSPTPATDTTAQYLLRLVANGSLDHILDELVAVIRVRRDATAITKRAAFQVGDRVRVNGHIKPAKLAGVTGVVVGKDAKFVRIDVDPAYHYRMGRYRTTNCGFPPNALELIAPPVTVKLTNGTLHVVK